MGKRPRRAIAGVAALGVLVNGCATMFIGTGQNVKLEVQPPATQVTVYRWDGTVVAGPFTSPGKAEVRRPQYGQSYIIVASKAGYCPRYWVTPFEKTNGGLVASAVIGAVLGVGVGAAVGYSVDATNGAGFNIEPDPVRGSLTAEQRCTE